LNERQRRSRIPGREEWSGYEADLDVRYAHRLFFGKSLDEVQHHFGGSRSIQRADELLFMPRRAFQYYVLAFAQFVMSEAATGDSDAASTFLGLLLNREKRDPGSVGPVFGDLQPAVEFVAFNQEHFEANPAIYGVFKERAEQVRDLVKANGA
jgi:hypothetical protein